MIIKKINIDNPDEKVIKSAVKTLENGGIIIYPTDTAYGLGVNALNLKSIKSIYHVKLRSFDKPTHVVVRDWKMIKRISSPPPLAKAIFKKTMPGPITIILPKKPIISDLLTAKKQTIGVRIPKNKVTQMMSSLVNFPYTTPSANISGGKTPYSIPDVEETLEINKIDFIIDAGELPKNPPSTILDLSIKPPKLLRTGPVTQMEIENIIGKIST